MEIKYFNDKGEELFPKYLATKDVWYLDRDGKKPVVYHLKDFSWLEDVAPLGDDSFQYKIRITGFWGYKYIWVEERDLFDNKKNALDKAAELQQYSKIKYKVVY